MRWMTWIGANWSALEQGMKIEAPQALVPPQQEGFVLQSFASPAGQVSDWTLSLSDRSRIHVHEYADGHRVVHRDKHDPDQGLGDMFAHLFKETPWGLVGIVGIGLLLSSRSK